MKKIIQLCVLLLFTNFLSAQEKKEVNISQKVKAEFETIYPKAKDVKWSQTSESTSASFGTEGKYVKVIFKADTLFANMIQTEITALPEAVKNHLEKYYKDYSIERAGKIHFGSDPVKNNFYYAADIKNRSISKRVICFQNGNEFGGTGILDKE